MTMRARFFAKGDRRWLCAPWSRSMFFHLMKYGGEAPPPQATARALPCCAAARARLLLPPQSCHQPCKSKARKSEGRATSAMESVQSQIASAPRYTAGTQRCRWVGCHRRRGGGATPPLPQLYTCTLHGLVFFLYVPCLATIILRFSPGSSTSPYSRAKSQILTPMCCYGFLYLLKH